MTKFAVRALLLLAALVAVSLRPSDVTIAAAFEGADATSDSRPSRSTRTAALEALESWERNGSVPSSAVHGSESITVHNPKSSPVVGGTWEIAALIEGSGDFRVSAISPTTIGAPGQDSSHGVDVTLERIRVEGQRVDAQWEGREWVARGNSGSVQVNVTLRVHTLGRHRVGMKFGTAFAYADNSAMPTFTSVATGTTGLDANTGHTMVFADFNGDGYPDMAKSDDAGGAGDPIRVLLNDRDGTFTLNTSVAANSAGGITYGDWDHDGDIDLAARLDSGGNNGWIRTNDGTGTSWAGTQFASNRQIEPVVFADIDSDGDLDVFAPGLDLRYSSNLAGTWTAAGTMPGGVGAANNGEGAGVADLNNDGRPDYIWNRNGSVCYVFLSSGANNFTQDTNVNTAGGVSGLTQDVGDQESMDWAWGDYDNDGDVDVFISGNSGVGLYRNDGTGAFTNVSVAAGVSITATTTGACWGDYDNDGDQDLLVAKAASTVLYKSTGSAGGYTFTNVTLAAGIKSITGPVGFCDFDLDGDLDIMSITGEYFRNDLSGTALNDYLKVQALGAGGTGWSARTPIGARVQLWDKTETTLLATQWIGCHQNNLQPWDIVHFGCDREEEYVVRVRFPSTLIEIEVTGIVPSLVGTRIGGYLVTQSIAVYENAMASYTAISGNPWGTLIMYGETAGTTALRVRTYDSINNVMGPEATAQQLSRELRWVARPVQNNDYDIMTVLTEHNNGTSETYYRSFRFNGQIWVSDWILGPYATRQSQIRSVDIAMETTSGDVIVVYGDGTDDPKYRTFVNGTWSAAADVFATDPGNTVEWVQLRAKPSTTADPNTNEIWLFYSDTDENVYACRWNGSSWDEATTEQTMTVGDVLKRNTSTANAEIQAFDAAYETLTGDLMFAYGCNATDTSVRYRTLASGGTTFAATANLLIHSAEAAGSLNRRTNTLKLNSDPLTDRIALGAKTTNAAGRMGGAMWSGTAWGSNSTLQSGNVGLNDGARAQHLDMLDMAWLPALQHVICNWADDDVDSDIDWSSWNRVPGGTALDWDDETDVAAAGLGEPRAILSWPNLDQTQMVTLLSNHASDLHLLRWNGTAFTVANGGAALELTVSTITNGTPFTLYSPENRAGTPGLWTGAVDSDWNNPANWHNWKVPSAIAITIPAGLTNYPVISAAGGTVTNVSIAAGATLDLTTAGTLTVTGTVSLSGTFQVDAGSTLTMGNGSSIAIASGGSMLGRGSDSTTALGAATITVANPATQSFTVTVATGGTLDLKGTAMTAGRIIPQNNVVLRLSDVSFDTLPTATTNFIDMTLVQTGTVNLRNLSFTRGSNVTAANARNILTAATTIPLTVYGHSGALGGESYDGDTTNRIHWQNNCLNLSITGSSFYTYEREFRIDHTKIGRGGLSNYPVYVTITDLDMVAKVQADGDDFRFVGATGTQLDHEIETWNTSTGKLTAWVEVPSLSDKVDTLIYLQYGNATAANQQNPSGVWDANHLVVWHLDDAATGTADDSTSNARDGTALGITATTGTFGDAANWSTASTGRYVQRAVTAFHPATVATYEAWVRINDGTARTLFSYATAAEFNAYRLEAQANLRPYIIGTNPSATSLSVNNGSWHHVAMSWSSTDGIVRVFVDGVAQGSVTINMGSSIVTTGGLVLGQDQDSVLGGYAAGEAWVGDIDEFRLSDITRTEAWHTTTYNNGLNPATFAVAGIEKNRGPNLVDIYDFLPGVGETLTISSTLSDSSGNDHITHADHRGILQLASFAGTINIDGIRFTPATTTDGISVAAGATGTVNFYNCAFLDLGTTKSTTVAGDNRAVVSQSGTTTLNAYFCTIDSNNAATAGFDAATSCLFTNSLSTGAAGTRATYVVDYNNKNFRPTYAMLNDAAYSVARHGTYTRELDGHVRSATTRIGAWEGSTTSATTVGNSDITNGAGGGTIAPRIIFNTIPANNSAGNAIYMTGSDGTNVYVTVLNRTTLAVAYVASFAGTSAGFVTFVQTSNQASQYWLYVSYDSDGNGTFDRVRRLKHTVSTSLTDSGDQSMLNRLGGAIDFTSSGGWAGQFSLQNSFTTGVLSGEYQVGLATPASFGSVHAWYVDRSSAGGAWWPTIALAINSGWAADSYSGTVGFQASPNPYSQPIVTGSPSSGQVMLIRAVDATNTASIVTLSRNLLGTSTVLNTYTGPTTIGESITGTPFSLFQVQARQLIQRTDTPGPLLLQWPTLTTEAATIPNHTGYGGVWGVPPVGFFSALVNFVALHESDGCFGAVAAMEYASNQNATAAFEPLDSAYSNASLRYDDDSGLPGGFNEGVARVIGTPTRLAYAPTPTTNAVIFCSTDAGLLYCWEAHPAPAGSANANRKGQLINGFPIRIEGGRITSCNAIAISDTTLLAKLNLPAPVAPATTRNVLACFTDRGQIILVRIPETP